MAALKPSTLRIGNRYRASRLKGPYDALIIGSGIGGLTTAALLSDLGWKVAVFEQHYTAGGYTHSYERNGYEWDVGVHYIGDMGTTTMSRRFMDYLSGGKLDWAPMDPEYDRFYIGNKVFKAVAGKAEFRANLLKDFPQEAAAIDRYLELLSEVGKAMRLHTMGRLLSPTQLKFAQPVLSRLLPKTFQRTTLEVLSELTSNRDLIAVLTGQWGDNGLPPSRSSFIIHAMIARHYMFGGFYPVGGSWKIADTIIPKIQAAGGEVFTYAKVKEIIVEGGKSRGVLMDDGTRIESKVVISCAGVMNTFEKLVPPAEVKKAGYDKHLKTVTKSCAHLGIYAGLKGTPEELGLPKTNFWIYPSNDYDGDIQRFFNDKNAPMPVVYISFPSAKDPDYSRRHPGTSTIEIVAPAPYEWFEPWKNTVWGKRGEDYDALKKAMGDRLMEALYEKMPQLRGKVDYYEVSTPLSTEYFNAYDRGELYGIDHDPKRFSQSWLTPKTKIPGLYLTGQDILSCGVVGAMMGGVLTAVSVGGFKMLPVLKDVMAGKIRKTGPRLATGGAVATE
ncbi:MAG: NAD(P)/FAD-dependent oxidoreductase [Fluviicoccus sp.]|uniref:phytoene desaturase family protein n=1 Tax=Fluviicoccus sp. TaxID=2003552 RepID=UPI0027220EEB|nr:NAD(P)/FAD-dependent oxidoreductase [Fluviicoccus sp.]MDO8330601.1 NAD(P)/FAD-dependent oxidoreductase [Fluviicoccus sp.]